MLKVESTDAQVTHWAVQEMEEFDRKSTLKIGAQAYLEKGEEIYNRAAWACYFRDRIPSIDFRKTIEQIFDKDSKPSKKQLPEQAIKALLSYPHRGFPMKVGLTLPLSNQELALALTNLGVITDEAQEVLREQRRYRSLTTEDYNMVMDLMRRGNLMGFLDEVEVPPIACYIGKLK